MAHSSTIYQPLTETTTSLIHPIPLSFLYAKQQPTHLANNPKSVFTLLNVAVYSSTNTVAFSVKKTSGKGKIRKNW